ncbi:t-SNARE affecting a late Golgi compartment protein 2 [Neolecta irregularis DAH-3]|uniref:t-SNARE affecting a late Golgi compartment protein 2 n=1 Tax=Neolecta irregularis (strain DAH-3) TaxID=1198029 RepID=A0A1U7LMM8_NEOID|nr:t-SNARE affecting a late Golgi compartment protein 2 [Neolecta irregularis DAH-3]|eukprot:OLL23899.1 t-SNARE affecting a late Golgi compartment protein 2 [Neolecta irregularis DAH-3]
MATRNRTNLYISYRQSYTHHPTGPIKYNAFRIADDDERQGLITGGTDLVIEMDILPPRWADISDQVADILETVRKKSFRLDKLHEKHALPGFVDRRDEEREIEQLTHEITQSFRECQQLIKRVQKQAQELDSDAQVVMAHNIQVSLASKVQDLSTQFRKKQSAYLKRLRMGAGTGIDRTGTSISDDGFTDISPTQSTQLQWSNVQPSDAAIIQREREIDDIAKGIIELADIFKDLQSMVIDQGTLLDRIDYNVETASRHVKAANVELDQAANYHKQTRKRKIMLLLVLLIVGMVIILFIRLGTASEPVTPKHTSPSIPQHGHYVNR